MRNDYDEAKELIQSQNYIEAEPIFARLWEQSNHRDAYAGWRYGFCVRKQGRLDEAEKIIRQVVEACPNDSWARSELIWTIYDARIKPAKHQEDLTAILKVVHEAIDLGAADLALRQIVFAVASVAKAKDQWHLVAEWCDKLDYTTLEDNVVSGEGHRTEARISQREEWFYKRVKAALELKDWETAEHFAEVATQNFPKNKHFRRWRATAQAERGDLAEAVNELSSLCSTGRPEWYELHDLALYEARLGSLQDALLHATRAALAHGENEQKVNLYQLMGHLWLKMNDYDKAAKMLTMTRLVYEQKDWNIPKKLEKLERATAKKLDEAGQCWPDTPNDASSIWREMRRACQEIQDSTLDFHSGKVKMVDEERGFGFIRPDDGSEDTYFKVRDAYKNITQGQQVRYVVIEKVDPKDKQVKPTAIKISLQTQASEVQ